VGQDQGMFSQHRVATGVVPVVVGVDQHLDRKGAEPVQCFGHIIGQAGMTGINEQ
jgi:hypothetical protein